jgi:hypothetical protein
VDRAFVLRAAGQPDVKGSIVLSFFSGRADQLREIRLVMAPDEYARMVTGVAYTLHPVNAQPAYAWQVKKEVTLTRPK